MLNTDSLFIKKLEFAQNIKKCLFLFDEEEKQTYKTIYNQSQIFNNLVQTSEIWMKKLSEPSSPIFQAKEILLSFSNILISEDPPSINKTAQEIFLIQETYKYALSLVEDSIQFLLNTEDRNSIQLLTDLFLANYQFLVNFVKSNKKNQEVLAPHYITILLGVTEINLG